MSLPRVCLLKQALTALPEIFKNMPCCCQKQQSELLFQNAFLDVEWAWATSHQEDIRDGHTYNLYFTNTYDLSFGATDAQDFCGSGEFIVELYTAGNTIEFSGINSWDWMEFDLEHQKLFFKGNIIENTSSDNYQSLYIDGWVYVNFTPADPGSGYIYTITYPSNFASEDVVGQITVYKQAPEA